MIDLDQAELSLTSVCLYLQALSAGIQNRSPKPGPTAQDLGLGYFLETGLQRAHVIHFKNG